MNAIKTIIKITGVSLLVAVSKTPTDTTTALALFLACWGVTALVDDLSSCLDGGAL